MSHQLGVLGTHQSEKAVDSSFLFDLVRLSSHVFLDRNGKLQVAVIKMDPVGVHS